jgi:hypothetical protein
MRGIRTCLIAAVALGVAAVSGAAGPMALTQDGDLYMASTRDNQVVITARYADGSVDELFIPQSAAAVEDSLQVGVDESIGAIYVLWQKNAGMDAKLRMAGYLDGTWIGPRTFAGGDGTAALNPAMLIHRPVSVVEDGTDENGEPVFTEVTTTFLHLAWWSRSSEDDAGFAMYAAVEIAANGVPQFNDMEPVELQGLFPYGIACFQFEANENLYHPKLFIDPASNNPHVLATDFGDCFFQILEIVPVVEDDEEQTLVDKRRRQIIILRKASMIALRPDLPLARGKLVVGSDLKLLMHWDGEVEDNVHYLELDEEGLLETKTLILDDTLDHEKAVELIRELAER